MKIFDCFTFLNEVELLELRLKELYDTVDYFVLVEANKTHTGNPKEFVFEAEQERYKSYLDKIIYIQVRDLPDVFASNVWIAENFQRNAISRGLNGLAKTGDKVLVSDMDEIPNVDAIKANLDAPNNEWTVFKQSLYYYYVNNRVRRNWGGTVMATYGYFKKPQDLRNCAMRHGVGVFPNGGWHYSYLVGNDPDRVLYKALNIADYFGYKLDNRDLIAKRIADLQDPYGRTISYMRTNIVNISQDKPKMLDGWLKKYPQFYYRGAM